MKVLIGFECSGNTRNAFAARGHDVWSIDLLPSWDNSDKHIVGDVYVHIANYEYDMAIFHPPCTYLTISAEWAYKDVDYFRYPEFGHHQKVKPETLVGEERRQARAAAIDDVRKLMALPYKWAIENPIGVLSTTIRKPDQIIQPYDFGEDASKATALWLQGLPLLKPTKYVEPRIVDGKKRWANQTDSGQNKFGPNMKNRAGARSETYKGISAAFAEQWG